MRYTAVTVGRGRRQAEPRMLSRCTIRRKTGLTTQDEDTGAEVPTWATVHTDLPFRLGAFSQAFVAKTRTVHVGGDSTFQQAIRVGHVPARVRDVKDGDFIEVTAGENAGLVFIVMESSWQDQATAQRFPLREVDRPGEWT